MPAVNLCWAFKQCNKQVSFLRFGWNNPSVYLCSNNSLSLSLSLSLKKADLYEDVEHEEELTTLYQGSALRAIC